MSPGKRSFYPPRLVNTRHLLLFVALLLVSFSAFAERHFGAQVNASAPPALLVPYSEVVGSCAQSPSAGWDTASPVLYDECDVAYSYSFKISKPACGFMYPPNYSDAGAELFLTGVTGSALSQLTALGWNITSDSYCGAGAPRFTAQARFSDKRIANIWIYGGGTGYTNGTLSLTISAPTGPGVTATGTATVVGGVITSVTITNPGSGYTADATVGVVDAFHSGSDAILVATPFRNYHLGCSSPGQQTTLPDSPYSGWNRVDFDLTKWFGWSFAGCNTGAEPACYGQIPQTLILEHLWIVVDEDDPSPPIVLDNISINASYVRRATPHISSVDDHRGSRKGNDTVGIDGSGFNDVQSVKFGTIEAAWFCIDSDTHITAKTASSTAAGPVAITVSDGACNNFSSTSAIVTDPDAYSGTEGYLYDSDPFFCDTNFIHITPNNPTTRNYEIALVADADVVGDPLCPLGPTGDSLSYVADTSSVPGLTITNFATDPLTGVVTANVHVGCSILFGCHWIPVTVTDAFGRSDTACIKIDIVDPYDISETDALGVITSPTADPANDGDTGPNGYLAGWGQAMDLTVTLNPNVDPSVIVRWQDNTLQYITTEEGYTVTRPTVQSQTGTNTYQILSINGCTAAPFISDPYYVTVPLGATKVTASATGTVVYGQSATLSAHIISNIGTVTAGTVNFYDAITTPGQTYGTGGTLLGSDTTIPAGNASYATTALQLTPGGHVIRAEYIGAGGFLNSPALPLALATVQVNRANVSLTLASNAQPAQGNLLSVKVTIVAVSPGGGNPADAFPLAGDTGMLQLFDNNVAIGSPVPLTVSPQTPVTFDYSPAVPSGTHPITVSYTPDADDGRYNIKTSTVLSQRFAPPTTNLLETFSTPTNIASVFGQSVTLRATISTNGGPAPAGKVVFMADGVTNLGTVNSLTPLGLDSGRATINTTVLSVGAHTLTSTFTPTGDFGTSTGNASFTVAKGNTSSAVVITAPSSVRGSTMTIKSTVTATAPAAGTPTGTVNFFTDNPSPGTAIGSATLSALGVATLTTPSTMAYLPTGLNNISAVYAGDTKFNGSTGLGATTVTKIPSTTTITSNTPNPAAGCATITFNITVAGVPNTFATKPSGTVVLYNNATPVSGATGGVLSAAGTATITVSTFQIGPAGTYPLLNVKFSTDANYSASTSANKSETITGSCI